MASLFSFIIEPTLVLSLNVLSSKHIDQLSPASRLAVLLGAPGTFAGMGAVLMVSWFLLSFCALPGYSSRHLKIGFPSRLPAPGAKVFSHLLSFEAVGYICARLARQQPLGRSMRLSRLSRGTGV